VGLSNAITYQIKVVNGLISIAINNKTNSFNIFQSDPAYTNETQYFKAGAIVRSSLARTRLPTTAHGLRFTL